MPVERIGKFDLEETIGAGAMSTVYRAVDSDTGERVAIKMLHPHLSSGENLVRFEREASALAALQHRNVVGFRSFSNGERGYYYLVLEYVEGDNLGTFLERERNLYPEVAALIILELANGMAAAHAKGIIHRDLKPENILIHRDGILKISDFGLAYLWEGANLTMPGTRIGSPAFMSPEQIRGEKPSPTMDVFSLGILFYRLLTGELPFKGKNRRETFKEILESEATPPAKLVPGVSRRLSRLCLRMIRKEGDDRITSTDEVVAELEKFCGEHQMMEYEDVLREYLRAPKDHRETIRKWLLEAYLRIGKQSMEEEDTARMLDVFRSILVLTGFSDVPTRMGEDTAPTKKVNLRVRARVERRKRLLFLVLAAVLLLGLLRLF